MPITGLRCPQCRCAVTWEGNDFRPFCSERCRTIDLGSWADEAYRISGNRAEPDADDNQTD